MKLFNDHSTKEKRTLLRQNQTEAELLLWQYLRKRALCGEKFCRQYGIGHYIADFYCPHLKLVIEIDGKQHQKHDVQKYDQIRTEFMNAVGIEVIRFQNEEIIYQTDLTLAIIVNHIELLHKKHPPALSLSKRGRRASQESSNEVGGV